MIIKERERESVYDELKGEVMIDYNDDVGKIRGKRKLASDRLRRYAEKTSVKRFRQASGRY